MFKPVGQQSETTVVPPDEREISPQQPHFPGAGHSVGKVRWSARSLSPKQEERVQDRVLVLTTRLYLAKRQAFLNSISTLSLPDHIKKKMQEWQKLHADKPRSLAYLVTRILWPALREVNEKEQAQLLKLEESCRELLRFQTENVQGYLDKADCDFRDAELLHEGLTQLDAFKHEVEEALSSRVTSFNQLQSAVGIAQQIGLVTIQTSQTLEQQVDQASEEVAELALHSLSLADKDSQCFDCTEVVRRLGDV